MNAKVYVQETVKSTILYESKVCLVIVNSRKLKAVEMDFFYLGNTEQG